MNPGARRLPWPPSTGLLHVHGRSNPTTNDLSNTRLFRQELGHQGADRAPRPATPCFPVRQDDPSHGARPWPATSIGFNMEASRRSQEALRRLPGRSGLNSPDVTRLGHSERTWRHLVFPASFPASFRSCMAIAGREGLEEPREGLQPGVLADAGGQLTDLIRQLRRNRPSPDLATIENRPPFG